MVAYTATSPIFALVAYIALEYGAKNTTELAKLDYGVAIALLTSVGTFLYVTTMHILPEVYGGNGHNHGEITTSENKKENYSKVSELVFLLLGMFTPLLIPDPDAV